ncbi:MAG: pantetheine-phosphate adenylyltransferase [Myxococcales bacterium]|nr:pantetheine-phosphate adenylyltransferase [Myxococcales bacterium]
MKQSVAIFPGSFDPVHNGHLDLIWRGLEVFDRLIVAVAHNVSKTYLFSLEERKALLQKTINDPRVTIDSFEGLLVDYAKKKGSNIVIRGLRAVSDFEYELLMANMNKKLYPKIETFFMMTSESYFFLRSNTVKEIARFGGEISMIVPTVVEKAVKEKF